ncbi:MAG TPA: DinB family protein [Acidimicrobiales bacterium]
MPDADDLDHRVQHLVTADDHREVWRLVDARWAATLDRALALPEATLRERVNGEWSFVETLRHLVFAVDVWLGRTLPFADPGPEAVHPLGLPHSSYPDDLARSIGVDVGADPSLADVLAAREEARALVRGVLADLADDDLPRRCPRVPAPGYDEAPPTVHECLWTVTEEAHLHHGYATRDLRALTSLTFD